jgi:predicted nucleic acid-binding protein
VVSDAGPLIHLDELGCLELLSDFSTVWVPDVVRAEIETHRPAALDGKRVPLRFHTAELAPDAALETLIMTLSLDRGEQSALQLVRGRPTAWLLTDDAAARLAAKTLGVRVHGSIGVLLRSIRRGRRSREEVLELLRSVPSKSTLHIRPSLLEEIIREVEDSRPA